MPCCPQDEVQAHLAASRRAPPKEVVVFLVGGTTYEEAKAVADLNARNPQVGPRVWTVAAPPGAPGAAAACVPCCNRVRAMHGAEH